MYTVKIIQKGKKTKYSKILLTAAFEKQGVNCIVFKNALMFFLMILILKSVLKWSGQWLKMLIDVIDGPRLT